MIHKTLNQMAIFELYLASSRAGYVDKQEISVDIETFLKNTLPKDINPKDFSASDIPPEVTRKKAMHFLDITKNLIIQMNGGIPKSQVLGSEYYECQKLLFTAETLNTLLYRRAALLAAEVLVKRAKNFYFLNLAFQAYRIIYTINRTLGDTKTEVRATESFRKYLNYYSIEKSIEIDYNSLVRGLNKANTSDRSLTERALEIIESYKSYVQIIPSFYFHNYYYNILYIHYINDKNHLAVYETAKAACDWFDNLAFEYIPGKLFFISLQIVYLIQKRDYAEGTKLTEKALQLVSSKSPHWYKVIEQSIILKLHQGAFTNAVELYFLAVNKKSFISLATNDYQRWMLYEAYINLVIECGAANFTERRKRFSIQKFINDLPQFSKDKRAMNIPILIAQMLFFIVRKQYNHAIDRIEALDKYSSRYLRNNETFRSNCFIKMLLEIPKNSFNLLRVERASEKYFRRLLDSEIDLIDQPFEIEIIPYERLWAMIMNHLRPDHHYTPKTPRTPQPS